MSVPPRASHLPARSPPPQLLTTANPKFDEDQMMFDSLGLKGKRAFANPLKPPPGYVEEPIDADVPLIDPSTPSGVPPASPPPKMPPSAPRPQPAMHAAAKA